MKARGWYGVHHEVQWIATLLLLFATLVCAVFLFRWFHRTATAVKAAAASLVVLLIVLILRAVSLHAVDAWSMHTFAGMRRGWWAESIAVATICLAAARRSGATVRTVR